MTLEVEVGGLESELDELLPVAVPVDQDLERLQDQQSDILVGCLKLR